MTPKEILTQGFIEALASGEIPWRKPWHSRSFKNLISKKSYRGFNVLVLGLFGQGEYYLTFNQIQQLSGKLTKGTRAIRIAFYKTLRDEDNDKNFAMLRYYNVFPAVRVEGIEIPPSAELDFVPHDRAEQLVLDGESLLSAPITYGSHRAAYTPALHTIELPHKENFRSIEEYYATAFHEIGHSLCEADQRHPVEPYSFEELCAEIFSCFALNECGLLSTSCFTNSKAYVQGWAKKLQSEPGLILKAASHAARRFDKLQATPVVSA
jgi:antirestriction protein ArdC